MTCPSCGAVSSLDALLGHEAARGVLVRALEQTPCGRHLIRYVSLFRPAKRNLSDARVASLLTELLDMIKSGRIERHGRLWAAPETAWMAAIDEIITRRDEGKLTTPLKSHGYLLEIISGQANKVEAKAEQRDEDLKAGRTQTGGVSHPAPGQQKTQPSTPRVDPEAARERMKKVKQALKPTHEGVTA